MDSKYRIKVYPDCVSTYHARACVAWQWYIKNLMMGLQFVFESDASVANYRCWVINDVSCQMAKVIGA